MSVAQGRATDFFYLLKGKNKMTTSKTISKKIIELLEKAEIPILRAENMCMASDGPVGKTITEMSDEDITEIYKAVHQALTLLKQSQQGLK